MHKQKDSTNDANLLSDSDLLFAFTDTLDISKKKSSISSVTVIDHNVTLT